MKKHLVQILRIVTTILIITAAAALLGGCAGNIPANTESEPTAGIPTVPEQEVFTPEVSTPEPAVTEPGVETVQGIVTVQASDVYSGPGITYEKFDTLVAGTAVTITGTANGWHEIIYGDDTAYIAVSDIRLDYTADPAGHTISPLAKNDLFPFAKSYSLAREIRPEYIMLHFCSAVVIDRQAPYNIALVRDNFIRNGVDTNYIIDRDGTIYCYVPEDRLAYHAGKGTYANDEKLTDNMNRYAIGIELLAIGSQKDMSIYLTAEEYAALPSSLIGYTDAQYEALNALITDICQRNSIPADKYHILGHDEYSAAKNDPGELFDWGRLLG